MGCSVSSRGSGAARVAKQGAALLRAAEEHLGRLLAELYVAMPSLAACGFTSSFLTDHAATERAFADGFSFRTRDDTSAALALVVGAAGVDTHGLRLLIADARSIMKQVSR